MSRSLLVPAARIVPLFVLAATMMAPALLSAQSIHEAKAYSNKFLNRGSLADKSCTTVVKIIESKPLPASEKPIVTKKVIQRSNSSTARRQTVKPKRFKNGLIFKERRDKALAESKAKEDRVQPHPFRPDPNNVFESTPSKDPATRPGFESPFGEFQPLGQKPVAASEKSIQPSPQLPSGEVEFLEEPALPPTEVGADANERKTTEVIEFDFSKSEDVSEKVPVEQYEGPMPGAMSSVSINDLQAAESKSETQAEQWLKTKEESPERVASLPTEKVESAIETPTASAPVAPPVEPETPSGSVPATPQETPSERVASLPAAKVGSAVETPSVAGPTVPPVLTKPIAPRGPAPSRAQVESGSNELANDLANKTRRYGTADELFPQDDSRPAPDDEPINEPDIEQEEPARPLEEPEMEPKTEELEDLEDLEPDMEEDENELDDDDWRRDPFRDPPQQRSGFSNAWPSQSVREVGLDIRERSNIVPPDRSGELISGGGGNWDTFSTAPKHFTWAAPNIRYQPLYLEDIALERYGQTPCGWAEAVVSYAHFFKSAALIPYSAFKDCPRSCDSPLGYCRPGAPAPKIIQRHFWR